MISNAFFFSPILLEESQPVKACIAGSIFVTECVKVSAALWQDKIRGFWLFILKYNPRDPFNLNKGQKCKHKIKTSVSTLCIIISEFG